MLPSVDDRRPYLTLSLFLSVSVSLVRTHKRWSFFHTWGGMGERKEAGEAKGKEEGEKEGKGEGFNVISLLHSSSH